MLTDYNAKQLSIAYKMSESNFHSYLYTHRAKLRDLATIRKNKFGKTIKSQNYNTKQLEYIIYKIFGDTPENHDFNGKTLIKSKSI